MKRRDVAGNLLRFGGFDLLAAWAADRRLSLREGETVATFAQILANEVTQAARTPTVVYGRRVEAIFEHVVAGIGACKLLKREDAGEVYDSAGGRIEVPDFRIVRGDGGQVLVEVKNAWSGKDPNRTTRLKPEYLDGLRRYADLMRCDLLVAMYWVNWRLWTAVSADAFSLRNGRREITFREALASNRFEELGDRWVATRRPIRIRISGDAVPAEEGRRAFTLRGRREFYSGDRRVTDPTAARLAFALAAFGPWPLSEWLPVYEGDSLVGVEMSADAPDRENEIAMLGPLSGIATNFHKALTEDDDGVVRTRSRFDPGWLGALMPPTFRSEEVPIHYGRVASSSPPDATGSAL